MEKYGALDVLDLTFINLETNKPEFYLNSCKITNISIEAAEIVQTGGKGLPELITWDMSKTGTLEIQEGLFNPKTLSYKTGNELKVGAEPIFTRNHLTAVEGLTDKSKVTLKNTPIAGTVTVFVSEDGVEQKEEVVNFTIETDDVIFDAVDVPIGEDLLITYDYLSDIDAETITITSDTFPGNYKIVGDTNIKSQDGVLEAFQIVVPNGKLNSNFTFTLDSSTPAVIDFNVKIMKAKDSTQMVKMIKYPQVV